MNLIKIYRILLFTAALVLGILFFVFLFLLIERLNLPYEDSGTYINENGMVYNDDSIPAFTLFATLSLMMGGAFLFLGIKVRGRQTNKEESDSEVS